MDKLFPIIIIIIVIIMGSLIQHWEVQLMTLEQKGEVHLMIDESLGVWVRCENRPAAPIPEEVKFIMEVRLVSCQCYFVSDLVNRLGAWGDVDSLYSYIRCCSPAFCWEE